MQNLQRLHQLRALQQHGQMLRGAAAASAPPLPPSAPLPSGVFVLAFCFR